MLDVLGPDNAIENQRLLRIVIAKMHENPIAFHVIQKEAQLGIVLLVGQFLFQTKAFLVEHRESRKRIPHNNVLVIDFFVSLACTQLEIMRARCFFARESDAHLRMHHIGIFEVLCLKEFKAKSRSSAPLGIY